MAICAGNETCLNVSKQEAYFNIDCGNLTCSCDSGLMGVFGIQNQWSGACSVQSPHFGQKSVAVFGDSPVEPENKRVMVVADRWPNN